MNDSPARMRIKNRPKYTKGDVIFYCILLALPLLQICVFYFGVNLQSFGMAFQRYDAYNNRFIWDASSNFSNFARDVALSGFWRMVGNSLLVWVVSSLTGTVLAVLFAYYVYKNRFMSSFYKVVLFLPSVLPSILLVVMFKKFTGEALPAYTYSLFGSKAEDVFASGSVARFATVTLFTVWISFGPQVLFYTGAMDQIPAEIPEAGEIDGATPFKEFVYLIVPSIMPTLGTFLITGVSSIFTNQNNLFGFVGQNAVPVEKTMGYYLYCLVYADSGMSGYCYAAFLGLICTFIVVPVAFGIRKAVERVQN